MASARVVIDDRLYAYLLSSQPPEHPELIRLRAVTGALPEARMQIAPEQGHLLAFLVRLTGATRVLEVGTFTGYSALAMALALPEGGRLVTCDQAEAWVDIGRPFWDRAGVAGKIEVMIRPAQPALDRLEREGPGGFDLMFVDADKRGYGGYYESGLRLVRRGGLIIFDNVFRRGRVADPAETGGDAASVREFNARIAGDERVDRVMLPIADGMTLAMRR